MSKTRGNTIVPDEMVAQHGADVLRLYLMFLGPFDATIAWTEQGLPGIKRFLARLSAFVTENAGNHSGSDPRTCRIVDRLVKKVGDDIGAFKFNTAIARQMEALNDLLDSNAAVDGREIRKLVQVLAPFAPFLAEECWQKLGGTGSVHASRWPAYDPELVQEQVVTVSVQVNGRLRGLVEADADAPQAAVEEQSRALEGVKRAIGEKEVQKVVYVKGRTINFVTK